MELKICSFILIGCVIGLAGNGALANDILSWQECVDLTKAKNADLIASEESLRAAKFSQSASYSGYFPQISINMSSKRSYSEASLSDSLGQLQTAGSTSDYHSANVSLTENLFSGFKTLGLTRESTASARVANANFRAAQAQASYDLKVAYQNYISAVQAIALAEDIVKRREENLRLVELRFEGGMENKGSVLLSQAYLADARYGLLQAQHQKDVAHTNLARVLGVEATRPFEVKDPIPVQDPPPQNPDFVQLASTTPDHEKAVAQVDVADAQYTIAKSAYFPTLDLVGSVGRSDNVFFPRNNNWSIGLNLTFPIFEGGNTYYSSKSSSANLAAVENQRTSIDQKLLTNLKQAYSNYTEAVSKLKVDAAYKEAASMRAEIARKKYNNGLLTFDDWDIIENDLITRERTYLQSQTSRVTAEAAWDQTYGYGVLQ